MTNSEKKSLCNEKFKGMVYQLILLDEKDRLIAKIGFTRDKGLSKTGLPVRVESQLMNNPEMEYVGYIVAESYELELYLHHYLRDMKTKGTDLRDRKSDNFELTPEQSKEIMEKKIKYKISPESYELIRKRRLNLITKSYHKCIDLLYQEEYEYGKTDTSVWNVMGKIEKSKKTIKETYGKTTLEDCFNEAALKVSSENIPYVMGEFFGLSNDSCAILYSYASSKYGKHCRESLLGTSELYSRFDLTIMRYSNRTAKTRLSLLSEITMDESRFDKVLFKYLPIEYRILFSTLGTEKIIKAKYNIKTIRKMYKNHIVNDKIMPEIRNIFITQDGLLRKFKGFEWVAEVKKVLLKYDNPVFKTSLSPDCSDRKYGKLMKFWFNKTKQNGYYYWIRKNNNPICGNEFCKLLGRIQSAN